MMKLKIHASEMKHFFFLLKQNAGYAPQYGPGQYGYPPMGYPPQSNYQNYQYYRPGPHYPVGLLRYAIPIFRFSTPAILI